MKTIRDCFYKLQQFFDDTLCLRNSFSMVYLMIINFIFCLVSFYFSREQQFWIIYGLLASIPLWNILFCPHRKTPVLDFLQWLFEDILKSFSIVLFSLVIFKLKHDEELHAFIISVVATVSLILSPVYNANNFNQKIISIIFKMFLNLKELFKQRIVSPLITLFEWVKWILCLQWLPVFFHFLRSSFVQAYAYIDETIFRFFRRIGHIVVSAFVYIFYLHWLKDIYSWLHRKFLCSLYIKLNNFYQTFLYIVKCQWFAPLMGHLSRLSLWIFLRITKLTQKLAVYLLSLTIVHILKPFAIVFWDQTKILWEYAYQLAIHPILKFCFTQYKFLEDLLFIYVLGPFFKVLLDLIPERNPFPNESDTDITEFFPKITPDAISDALNDLEDEINASCELSHSTSIDSIIGADAKILSKQLKKIAISESDSDDQDFLPTNQSKKQGPLETF